MSDESCWNTLSRFCSRLWSGLIRRVAPVRIRIPHVPCLIIVLLSLYGPIIVTKRTQLTKRTQQAHCFQSDHF